MKIRGFTLIELLIVVAIIAILAAIAVPNFLEAQMRAKVTRAKADMRTLATTIETYRIDNNEYSTDCGNGAGGGIYRPYRIRDGHSNPPANFTIGFELTTPIAYITSAEMLLDPFKKGKWDYYKTSTVVRGREYYFFMNIPLRRKKNGNPNSYSNTFRATGAWALWAAGPDGWCNNIPGGGEFSEVGYIPRRIQYDATNGTISNGDIHRTQKYPDGIGPQT